MLKSWFIGCLLLGSTLVQAAESTNLNDIYRETHACSSKEISSDLYYELVEESMTSDAADSDRRKVIVLDENCVAVKDSLGKWRIYCK